MYLFYTIYWGHLLSPISLAVLIAAVVVLLLGKQNVCGISRQDWTTLAVISIMALLAVVFILFFNYYHWKSGIAVLDRFDPNVDVLKFCNVAFGCLSIGMTIELFKRRAFKAGVIGITAALPGASTILSYG